MNNCKCGRCGLEIPYDACRCNHCNDVISFNYSTTPFPPHDMYGNPIKNCDVDLAKTSARNVYMQKQSVTIKQDVYRMQKQNQLKENKFRWAVGSIGLLIALALIASLFDTHYQEYIIGLFFPILGVAVLVYFIRKWQKKRIPDKPVMLEAERLLHDVKFNYYYTNMVFGYTKLETAIDELGDKKKEYSHYEVLKTNIKAITYDTKNAEYVLYLHKPVYTDYKLPPQFEFRIQDIFSERVLTQALNCDLPPRNVPF